MEKWTYGDLMVALNELSNEQLNQEVVIVKDRECYKIEDCRLVGTVVDPSLQEKLETQDNLHETYPLLMI